MIDIDTLEMLEGDLPKRALDNGEGVGNASQG